MARAGYDPQEAVRFWERMEAAGTQGDATSSSGFMATFNDYLATHPSHETRIQDLKARMPTALEIYREAKGIPENSNRKTISPDAKKP